MRTYCVYKIFNNDLPFGFDEGNILNFCVSCCHHKPTCFTATFDNQRSHIIKRNYINTVCMKIICATSVWDASKKIIKKSFFIKRYGRLILIFLMRNKYCFFQTTQKYIIHDVLIYLLEYDKRFKNVWKYLLNFYSETSMWIARCSIRSTYKPRPSGTSELYGFIILNWKKINNKFNCKYVHWENDETNKKWFIRRKNTIINLKKSKCIQLKKLNYTIYVYMYV